LQNWRGRVGTRLRDRHVVSSIERNPHHPSTGGAAQRGASSSGDAPLHPPTGERCVDMPTSLPHAIPFRRGPREAALPSAVSGCTLAPTKWGRALRTPTP
jgi:hypothetical protein